MQSNAGTNLSPGKEKKFDIGTAQQSIDGRDSNLDQKRRHLSETK
jgi:hypothetical protein